jgi:DNA adenine methylase
MILQSPLNYTGSKSKLIERLIPLFPQDVKKCYDLFCGGGGFFSNVVEQFNSICANDVIVPLVEFYKILQTKPWDELIDELDRLNIPRDSQEKYLDLRKRYNKERNPIDFFLLACSCTNNMIRFNNSGGFNQTWGKRHFNVKIQEKLKAYHDLLYRNEKVVFSCGEFDEVEIEDDSFVYLDPPYFITEGGYNLQWGKKDEERLYDFLTTLDGRGVKFMMSNVGRHNGVMNANMHRLEKYNLTMLPEVEYFKVSRKRVSDTEEFVVCNY